jgi:hypothetical protein
MQKGYENVTGWLGIMMGDKIFINFMKYEFSECVRRLKAEIDQHYTVSKKSTNQSLPGCVYSTSESLNYTLASPNSGSIRSWSAEMIADWFNKKNNINQGIRDYIKGHDGEVIHQIYVRIDFNF